MEKLYHNQIMPSAPFGLNIRFSGIVSAIPLIMI